MDISEVSLPSRRYVAVRHKGAYNKIDQAIERLFELTMPLGIEVKGAVAGFWYDDPMSVPEEELNSAAAFPVYSEFEIEHDELFTFDLPAAEYLTSTYFGPDEGLIQAWGDFTDAVRDREPDWHACFEEYMNDRDQVALEEVETRLLVRKS